MGYWAFVVGRTETSLEERGNILLAILVKAATSWDEQHDFSKVEIGKLYEESEAVKKLIVVLSRQLKQWGAMWVALASILAIVSATVCSLENLPVVCLYLFQTDVFVNKTARKFYFFTAQYLLRMIKKAFMMCDTNRLACRGERVSLMWIELEKEFREHFVFFRKK